MDFNKHSNLVGQHAFLSPSNYYWLNDDPDKLTARYLNAKAAQRGTELHALAENMIRLGVKPTKNDNTFNAYVNDAIGYRMTPEQVLYFSPNCFGTTDAISDRRNELRIHDLKTGKIEADMRQLIIYAALYCHEYGVHPEDLNKIELRIYQNNDVKSYCPDPEEVQATIDKIKLLDKHLESLKAEE